MLGALSGPNAMSNNGVYFALHNFSSPKGVGSDPPTNGTQRDRYAQAEWETTEPGWCYSRS